MSESNVIIFESPARAEFLRGLLGREREVWRGRLFAAVTVLVLSTIGLSIHYLVPFAVNVTTMRILHSVATPSLPDFMRLVSSFSDAPRILLVTMLALLACRRSREAFWLTWSGLGGWLLSLQLKALFRSAFLTRGVVSLVDQVEGDSFPSVLLVFYLSFFGFLFFIAYEQLIPGSFTRRLVLTLTAGLIFLAALSGVYLGELQLTDVPGSWVLGGTWLFLSLRLYRRWTRIHQRQQDWFLPYRTTK